MQVVHFTDPGCPYSFSAEPQLLRLSWTYGAQLEWQTTLVVIAETAAHYEAKGITPAKFAAGQRRMQREHGMPFDATEHDRMWSTEPACRAVVAVRRHRAELHELLLRRLRVRFMGGVTVIDDQQLIDAAAADVGIDPQELAGWMAEPETSAALEEDMRLARTPLPAASNVLDHKLANADDGTRRYSTPTLELRVGDRVLVAPGAQPWETYDVLVANLDPDLERRDPPASVEALLEWAPWPLAAAEVAHVMGTSIEEARTKLGTAARFEPIGSDGYWSLD